MFKLGENFEHVRKKQITCRTNQRLYTQMVLWEGSRPSSRDQKGFERRVYFIKGEERLLIRYLVECYRMRFFYQGMILGSGVGRGFPIAIQVDLVVFDWFTVYWYITGDFLGWVALYEFSHFSWKTTWSSALEPKCCVTNSSLSSPPIVSFCLLCNQWVGETEQKDTHVLLRIFSIFCFFQTGNP